MEYKYDCHSVISSEFIGSKCVISEQIKTEQSKNNCFLFMQLIKAKEKGHHIRHFQEQIKQNKVIAFLFAISFAFPLIFALATKIVGWLCYIFHIYLICLSLFYSISNGLSLCAFQLIISSGAFGIKLEWQENIEFKTCFQKNVYLLVMDEQLTGEH